jgi:hypothetical protein
MHMAELQDDDKRYNRYVILDNKIQDYLRHCLAQTKGDFSNFCGAIGLILGLVLSVDE